jgi:hypothetical protein
MSTNDLSTQTESNRNIDPLPDKMPSNRSLTVEIASSHHGSTSVQRSNQSTAQVPESSAKHVPRSNTMDFINSAVSQHQPPLSMDLSAQQWNFINQYPTELLGTNEHVPTKYITEIYDRATNRFIPTTCCY